MGIKGNIRFRSPYHEIHLYSTYTSASKPEYVVPSIGVVVRNVYQQIPHKMANALLFAEAVTIAFVEGNDVEPPIGVPRTTPERVNEACTMGWRVSPSTAVNHLSRIYDVYVPGEEYDEAVDTSGGAETVHVRFSAGCDEDVGWSEIDWDWDERVVDAAEVFEMLPKRARLLKDEDNHIEVSELVDYL